MGGSNKNSSKKETQYDGEDNFASGFGFDVSEDNDDQEEEEVPNLTLNDWFDYDFERLP